MTAATGTQTVEERLAAVTRPVPVMSREESEALTDRQGEILRDLTRLINDGFAHLTMADIASSLGCSLRTLYGIAGGRDLLVLVACDHNLWGAGRGARDAVRPTEGLAPLETVRRYLKVATRAVNATTAAFSADLNVLPGGREIRDAHTKYLVAVTKELLDMAVEHGEIRPVDTVVFAHAMAGISSVFIQPDVIDTLPGTPKEASDEVVEIILRGLTAPESHTEST